MDLVAVIVGLWEKTRFTPHLQHVYGHSDSRRKKHFTPLQLLNITMDDLAKEIAMAYFSIPDHCPPSFYSEFGLDTILCHEIYISSRL